jgi:hypothetical protein
MAGLFKFFQQSSLLFTFYAYYNIYFLPFWIEKEGSPKIVLNQEIAREKLHLLM